MSFGFVNFREALTLLCVCVVGYGGIVLNVTHL